MKSFVLGLTLASLFVFIQGANAATPTPSATRTTSPSPVASASATPRPSSDPGEDLKHCAFVADKTPDKFTCFSGTENVTDCSTYIPCIIMSQGLSPVKGKCLSEKKTTEECALGSVPPDLPTASNAPSVQARDLGELAESLYRWSLRIIGLAVLIIFFVGLFMQLTAAGLPVQVGQAKSLMTNAVYGAALLLAAYLLLNTINPDFVKQSGTLPALPTPENNVTNSTPTPTLPTSNSIQNGTPNPTP